MILLVVDMQKCLVDEELYAYDTFIDRTARLISAARKNRVEVIYVQHDAGPGSGLTAGDSGFEIADEFVLGYGLDYAQKYRNLPYIAYVEQEE